MPFVLCSSMPPVLVLCMRMAQEREHLSILCCLEEDRRGTSEQGKDVRCVTQDNTTKVKSMQEAEVKIRNSQM